MQLGWLTMLALEGCTFGYRIGVSATFDGSAHPGAAITLGGSFGPAGQDHHALLLSVVADGAVVRTKPVTGEFRAAVPLEWMVRWRPIAFRVGAAVGVSVVAQGYREQNGPLVGARLAILPAVLTRSDTNRRCPADGRQLHVGLAGSADYEWSAHRPLFMIGPTFEGYYYGFCD